MPRHSPKSACSPTPKASASAICSDFVGFETVPTELQFHCEWAVYRVGNNSSMCYTTSKLYGDLIVAALDAFVKSGEAEQWVKNQNTALGKSHKVP